MKWNGFNKCYIAKSCLFFFLLFEKRLYNLMYSICKNYFNCRLAEYTTYDYVCYIFHEMWTIKRQHCLLVPACTGSCSTECRHVGDLRRGSILFMLFQSTDWATWGKKQHTASHGRHFASLWQSPQVDNSSACLTEMIIFQSLKCFETFFVCFLLFLEHFSSFSQISTGDWFSTL